LCDHAGLNVENAVSVNVKLSEGLVNQAKSHAQVQQRSVSKQIEYWSKIGKIAEENPDLPFFVIRDILIADQEAVVGEYVFS
jgi:ParD-like antitoxin of type II bacterial toxin-antitoxin system